MSASDKQAERLQADRAAAIPSRVQLQASDALAPQPAAGESQAPAAASALVDSLNTDSAAAVAAREAAAVADAVLPTAAPAAISIGELAQASAETVTDAKAEDATATTEAATPAAAVDANGLAGTSTGDAGGAATTGWNPWLIGGLAVLGVGGVAAAAGGGGSSSPAPGGDLVPAPITPPAPTPAPAPGQTPAPGEVPAPGAEPPPTPAPLIQPAGTVHITDYSKPGETTTVDGLYLVDSTPNGEIDAGERVIFYSAATGHYYELVHASGGVTWDAAQAIVSNPANGAGYLATIESDAEAAFIRAAFAYTPTEAASWVDDSSDPSQSHAAYPGGLAAYLGDEARPVYGGLPIDNLAGDAGAWLGLQANEDGEGYSWLNANGGFSELAPTSALWLVHDGNARPGPGPYDTALRGAIVGGNNNTVDMPAREAEPSQMLYVQGESAFLNYYLVEYDSLEEVNATLPPPPQPINPDALMGGVVTLAHASSDIVGPQANFAALLDSLLTA